MERVTDIASVDGIDAVFVGPQIFHAEHSSTLAAGPLAEAALAAEQAVCAAGGLVVRTHAYGWGPAADEAGFAERFWQALDAGVPVAADAGETRPRRPDHDRACAPPHAQPLPRTAEGA